ncbi:hypothetical protein FH972_026238 [Carpinus fangiana]|uniref:Zn(2)-C6 fungal-type domain-containing protein n=1 Tax=Carpinus fangiana TaxID=176857 RepID=A0A5N6L3S2_9ROSI|nr:hypothetical protein FH972_026238 [Carpinus fangiana]
MVVAGSPEPARPGSARNSSNPPVIRRRNRKIASCLECRRRKLKCDHQHPCGNCSKNSRDCLFIAPAVDPESRRRLAAVKDQVQSLETGLGKSGTNPAAQGDSWSSLHYETSTNNYGHKDGADSASEDDNQQPSALAVEDVAYEEDADDLLDLGVQLGRMRVSERIGSFVRPALLEEIAATLRRHGESTDLFPPTAGTQGSDADEDGVPFYLQPTAEYIAPDAGFLFSSGLSQEASLAHCLPPKLVTDALIARYWAAVHPVSHAVHRPSFEKRYDSLWRDVAAGTMPPYSSQAMVFAALLSATASMPEEEVKRSFRSSRLSFINNFRQACEYALAKANVLRTTKLETIQAFVMYLIPCCRSEVTRVHATLVSAAIRIAECAGLHRDGTNYGLSPLETHVRRLVWHQLCFLDMRTCDAVGPRPQIRAGEFDTKIPLNVNDDQFFVDTKDPPAQDATHWTDMTHMTMRSEWVDFYRYLWINRLHKPGQPIKLTASLKDIEEWRRRFERKWLPMLDDAIPIQGYALRIARLLTIKLSTSVTHHFLAPGIHKTPERLTSICISTLSASCSTACELETNPRFRLWSWYVGTYQQYHPALLLTRTLLEQPERPESDAVWPSLDYVFDLPSSMDKVEKARLVIGELHRRLQVFRARRRHKSSLAVEKEMERLSMSPFPSPQQATVEVETPPPNASIQYMGSGTGNSTGTAGSSPSALSQTMPMSSMFSGGMNTASPSLAAAMNTQQAFPSNISMDIDWIWTLILWYNLHSRGLAKQPLEISSGRIVEVAGRATRHRQINRNNSRDSRQALGEIWMVLTCPDIRTILDKGTPAWTAIIPFLHAVFANSSMRPTSTTPLTASSSSASTAASATTSAFKGFVPPAPINHVNRPPVNAFATDPIAVTPANPTVILRDASYNIPGRRKILRSPGNSLAIVLSACRFVSIYRRGSTGAPALALTNTKLRAPAACASRASATAESRFMAS